MSPEVIITALICATLVMLKILSIGGRRKK